MNLIQKSKILKTNLKTYNNNIFEGAEFGDKFITKSGRVAVFLSYNIEHDKFAEYPVHMILEGNYSQTVYTTNGIPYIEDIWGWENKEKVIEDLSIVSHY